MKESLDNSMELKKIGNIAQIVNIMEGNENGVELLNCKNGRLSLTIIISKCLDIHYLSFAGDNLSYICKNGLKLQNIAEDFDKRFNGGFLFTCGLDNIGRSNVDITHGTLCFNKASILKKEITWENNEVVINVSGEIKITKLFGENIVLTREYKIYSNRIILNDRIQNLGYSDFNCYLLYHFNIGYPMLDEDVFVLQNGKKIINMGNSENNAKEVVKTNKIGDTKNEVQVINNNIKKEIEFKYDTKNLSYLTTWESRASGDYALGIEPMTTSFEKKEAVIISMQEMISNKIEINFKEL